MLLPGHEVADNINARFSFLKTEIELRYQDSVNTVELTYRVSSRQSSMWNLYREVDVLIVTVLRHTKKQIQG